MRRQEVEIWIVGLKRIAELGVGIHRLQETGGSEGVVAGPGDVVDAERVGLQFLFARELGKAELAAGQRHLTGGVAGQHFADDAAGQFGGLLALLALDAVIGGDVAHLVADDRGDLGRIVGQRQQAAGDVDVATWQCEGVDIGRVENGDAVRAVGIVGRRCQLADDRCQHALQFRVRIGAAIGRQDLRVLGATDHRLRIALLDVLEGDGCARFSVAGAHAAIGAGDTAETVLDGGAGGRGHQRRQRGAAKKRAQKTTSAPGARRLHRRYNLRLGLHLSVILPRFRPHAAQARAHSSACATVHARGPFRPEEHPVMPPRRSNAMLI